MEYIKGRVTKILTDYFENDYRRITHALDVLKYSEKIIENMRNYDYDIVVSAALLHDVGIKKSEDILGYNNGKTQEKYGPAIARELLSITGLSSDKINKICEIIGNHHSKSRFDYVELEILKEADKIVNKMELEWKQKKSI